MPPADNAHFLVEASKTRSRQARERAEETIKAAARRSGRPTVVGIANAAGVSRSWLYMQTDLITAINQLQKRAPAPQRSPRHAASEASRQRRLETALERNRQLRDQVADLTRKLETAHGEIRRLRVLGSPPGRTVLGPSPRVYRSGVNDTTHDRLTWEMTGWDANESVAHVTELSREEILRIRDLFDRRLPAGQDEWLACAAYEVTHDLQVQLLSAIPRLEFRPGLDYFVEGAVLSD
ncbi:DUF6262 family protein [Streptomyces sp. NPDC085942]|uniref:DUF6262 family protein n=1 Tax=Streptomyces sp. NPDC085942 TaxID=3365743 RepID=UPI0037D4E84C